MAVCALSGWKELFAAATTSVPSKAALLALFAAGSPPPLTATLFVTVPTALDPTPTVSVIALGLVAPAAMTALLVHVTTCAAAEQLQPVPAALEYVRPEGNVSVTVIVPDVAAVPSALSTVMV